MQDLKISSKKTSFRKTIARSCYMVWIWLGYLTKVWQFKNDTPHFWMHKMFVYAFLVQNYEGALNEFVQYVFRRFRQLASFSFSLVDLLKE